MITNLYIIPFHWLVYYTLAKAIHMVNIYGEQGAYLKGNVCGELIEIRCE